MRKREKVIDQDIGRARGRDIDRESTELYTHPQALVHANKNIDIHKHRTYTNTDRIAHTSTHSQEHTHTYVDTHAHIQTHTQINTHALLPD